MKAFIVGITGFVGSHLAEHLLAHDVQVIGCSLNAKWGPGATLALATEVPVFSWDLQQPVPPGAKEQVSAFAPDWIFHLGAISTPQDCGPTEPTPAAWNINVGGTDSVTKLALALEKPPRVLFASSCHVYGPVASRDPYVSEDAKARPNSGYGKTKLAAEERFMEGIEQGMNGVVARAFHHTGPRQSPRMVLPDWAQQFVRDDTKPIQVHTLDAYLDLSDVRDIVEAYRLLAMKSESDRIYNIGSGICRRSGDIFQQLQELVDSHRDVVETAAGRRQQPVARIDRIKKDTGWKPQIPFETTLRDTLEYWRIALRTR